MTISELDLDTLSSILETIRESWDSLTPEQQADVANRIDAAFDDSSDGSRSELENPEESEFQRFANLWALTGLLLKGGAALAATNPGTATIAPVLAGYSKFFIWLGVFGRLINADRAVDIGSWLGRKVPKAYKVLCNNPSLVYGPFYRFRPEGPWYMMDSCPVESDMLTVGPSGLVSPAEIAAGGGASIPVYPSWATDSSSSSSSSSSLIKFGLIAGAAYLVFK